MCDVGQASLVSSLTSSRKLDSCTSQHYVRCNVYLVILSQQHVHLTEPVYGHLPLSSQPRIHAYLLGPLLSPTRRIHALININMYREPSDDDEVSPTRPPRSLASFRAALQEPSRTDKAASL